MGKSKPTKDLSGGCLSLFGLPFLAAGLFLSGLYFAGYMKWWSARSWDEVPCWIESTDLESHRGDDSTTYLATATYRYQYQGRSYQGERVTFDKGADNIGSFQQDAHRELSRYVGKKRKRAEADAQDQGREPFRCYVNPANPEEAVLYRLFRWPMHAFMAVFALTFPAVGAGLVVGGLIGVRSKKREAALQRNHPEEPWKWKSGWADASIPEASSQWSVALYSYTVWSALVIFPLLGAMAVSGAFQESGLSWLVLIFVVFWCVPAGMSLRRMRQRIAVGKARFVPDRLPAWPGGRLDGAVILARPFPMRHAAELTLTCEKKITRRSGKNTSTSTEKVWSREQSVRHDGVTRDVSGFRLPVGFALPGDAPESGATGDPQVRHEWKLRLKVPGTAIESVFEVPVFRTADSPLPDVAGPDAGHSILDDVGAELPALLADARIRAEFDSAGRPLSLVCPPARHRSLIVFLFLFDLVWTAVAVFLIIQEAPLIFRLVWPVSAAGIWLLVIWNLLHKRTTTFDATRVEVRNQLGPVVWTQAFEKSQVLGFSHDTNMSSNNTNFYRVRLKSVTGKSKTLADGITESGTAAALVKQMEAWKTPGR